MNLTDNYLDLVKKRVFNSQGDDKASAVSCLRLGLSVILRLLSPVMPTITDEIWSWCFSKEYNTVSIHESKWPTEEEFSKYKKSKFQNSLEIAIKAIRSVRQSKTSEGIGLGKPVQKMRISTNSKNFEILELISNDFSNASNCFDFEKEDINEEEIKVDILIKADDL